MNKRIGILASTMSSYFVKRIVAGMHEALIGGDVELKTYEMHGKSPAEYHEMIESMATNEELSGLVYAHLWLTPNQVGRFKMRGIPVVGIGERMAGLDWIAVDEVKGAYLATKHLLDLGHRRITLLNGPVQVPQLRMREEGFLKAAAEFGMEFGVDKELRIVNCAEYEAKEQTQVLLERSQPPSAIFVAAGDVAALGVLAALREAVLPVPQKISVVGFDNLEFTRYIYPQLSTVNQPLEAMGCWAVKQVLERMADPYAHRPYNEVLEPELMARESSAGPGGYSYVDDEAHLLDSMAD